jgi:hypothetical protein
VSDYAVKIPSVASASCMSGVWTKQPCCGGFLNGAARGSQIVAGRLFNEGR